MHRLRLVRTVHSEVGEVPAPLSEGQARETKNGVRHTAGAAVSLSVLFVGGYDSSNYAYVELVRELKSRGHHCTVLVENVGDSINNKMFARAGIEVTALADFDHRAVPSVDIVFSGPYLKRPYRKLFDAIYANGTIVVTFANLFSSVTMRVTPDLVLTSGEAKFADFTANGLDYPMVAVGNPQYDPLIRARRARERTALADIRKVLIVDQGAYPFGVDGKVQLAETLIAIARNNPDVEFHVKPRYLPKEDGEHLHTVSEHLFSYLADAPENLVLIHKATILEELILEFDAMITTWSTAHLDAVALDMPLLLIDGLDSTDVFDVRRQRVAAAYEHLRATGCVVNRLELLEGPCRFGHVSQAYTSQEFWDVDNACAPRIVDLVERLSADACALNYIVAEKPHLAYDGFMEALDRPHPHVVAARERAVDRQLRTAVNSEIQSIVFDHRYMGYALDVSRLLPLWRSRLANDATPTDVARESRAIREMGLTLRREFFELHPDQVAEDMFVQDQYFDFLRKTRRRAELIGYSGPVVAAASLEFNRGIVRLSQGRLLLAARNVIDSFDISLRSPDRMLKKDRDIRVLLSRTDTSLLAHAVLIFMCLYSKSEALANVEIEARRRLDALVYYRMRGLAALGRPHEAVELFDEYVSAIESRVRRPPRPGLMGLALRVVTDYYGHRAKRYADRLR